MQTPLKMNASPTAVDFPHGVALLRDPLLNKGTAFSEKERDAFGLRACSLHTCCRRSNKWPVSLPTCDAFPMTLINILHSTPCTIAMRHCSFVSFARISMKFSH